MFDTIILLLCLIGMGTARYGYATSSGIMLSPRFLFPRRKVPEKEFDFNNIDRALPVLHSWSVNEVPCKDCKHSSTDRDFMGRDKVLCNNLQLEAVMSDAERHNRRMYSYYGNHALYKQCEQSEFAAFEPKGYQLEQWK